MSEGAAPASSRPTKTIRAGSLCYFCTALALALLKLWFVAAQPLTAVAGAWHDDRLFVWLAERIVHGEWLGDYSNLTLAKGCGYPLFIAGAFRLGIPLPMAEA